MILTTYATLLSHGPVFQAFQYGCRNCSTHRIDSVDRPTVDNQLIDMSSKFSSDADKARILFASSSHSGDWLMAPSIPSIIIEAEGRNALIDVGFELELLTHEPHTYPCGKEVELHGLSFRRSTARQQRHAELSNIVWRAVKPAQIPVAKEPVGLTRTDENSPDGSTLITWSRGKSLALDVIVPDTFNEFNLKETSILSGAAANRTVERTKYTAVTYPTYLRQLQSRRLERERTRPSKPYRK